MANTFKFIFDNKTIKTNGKKYFAYLDEAGKTHQLKGAEYDAAKAYFENMQAPAEDNKPAPEDNKQDAPETPEAPKTERKPKGQRFDAEAKAITLAPLAKEYTIKEDARGRIAYMQDKAKIVGIQPAKDHYTVYISKHLLATPEQVMAALKDTFKIEAKVNPTYIVNKGHDSFSVKATVTNATRDQLDNLVDLLIVKNNEVAKA